MKHGKYVCRYTRGGLIEQAFYIQIANAILPEITDLLNPFAFLTSRVLARYTSQCIGITDCKDAEVLKVFELHLATVCIACSACLFADAILGVTFRYAHTQPMMDLLLAPESFLLSERYASAVKTLGLAIFFMPVLPLSCVIALAGHYPQLRHSRFALGHCCSCTLHCHGLSFMRNWVCLAFCSQSVLSEMWVTFLNA